MRTPRGSIAVGLNVVATIPITEVDATKRSE
jgi:hypothetical protein